MLDSSPTRAPLRLGASAGRRAALAASLAVAFASACTLPDGDQATPKGVHYATLNARVQGDGARLWELLAPSDRELFDRWVEADHEGAKLVTTSYPPDQRGQALAAFPTRTFASGHDLFVSLVGAGGPLGLGARAGARVRDVKATGDTATVTTWGDDKLTYTRGSDGRWYCTLSADERATLTTRVQAAKANLAAVKTQVKRLLSP